MELHSVVAREMENMSILAGASTKSVIRQLAVSEIEVRYGGQKIDIPQHVIRTVIKDAAARVMEHCGETKNK